MSDHSIHQSLSSERTKNTDIKTYRELNRIIIRGGLGSPARFWYLARHLDEDGSGIVDRADLRRAMTFYGLTTAHLRTARNHEQSSVFFILHEDKIELRSLLSVCTELRTVPGAATWIPARSMAGVESWRANLYGTYFAGPVPVNFARVTLEKMFGVDQNTLRRWERTIGLGTRINVNFNMVEVAEADADAAAEIIPEDHRLDRDSGIPIFTIDGIDYYRWINTYKSFYRCGLTGNTKKIGRAVKGKAVIFNPDGERPRRRILYPESSWNNNTHQLKACAPDAPGCLWASGDELDTSAGTFAILTFSQQRPTPRKDLYAE
jgi:hypothetical protein